MAGDDLVRFDFGGFTDTVRRYIDEVEKLARDKRDQIVERNRLIQAGVFPAVNNPRPPRQAPPAQSVPPGLDLPPTANGLASLPRPPPPSHEALPPTAA